MARQYADERSAASKLSEALTRIEKLDREVRAMRDMTKLLVEARNADELAERACRALVASRGYDAARLVRTDERGACAGEVLHSQPGAATQTLVLSAPTLPPCCAHALQRRGDVLYIDDHRGCDCVHHPGGAACTPALATALSHEGQLYGVLFAYLRDAPPDADERRIFGDLASDLALALHNIEVKREGRAVRAALRTSENKYRTIFETVANVIVVLDEHGVIVECNSRVTDMLGSEPAALVGRALEQLVHPDDRARVGELVARAQRAPRLRHVETCKLFHVDSGEVINVELSAAAPQAADAEQPNWRVVCLIEDIRRRLELQASLAQADRMSNIGLLAAGVAHEINNPLTYVLSNLEQLYRELASHRENPACAEIFTLAEEALQGAQQMRDVTRALKTFSRADTQRREMASVNKVIDGVLKMAFNEIKYRAHLVKHYGDVPAIVADEGQLAQVFLNLIVNATHAIGEGDVAHNELSVSTRVEGNYIVVAVRDTGSGIAPEHMPHIFEPFFSTKEVGVGSGLGLSICRNIVEQMGGRLDALSELGRGSCFTVRLPLAQRAVERPRAQSDPRQRLRELVADRSVLIVDDELFVAKALARMLRGARQIDILDSGVQAHRRLADGDCAYDVIFCDVMMPSLSGMELYDWLQRHEPGLAERVIFMSGGAFTPRASGFVASVENPLVEKPFNAENLVTALKALPS
ncbi:MAG: PAS domain S-box protein [Myxococcales bacterium]|nr:PAS domain S-box protein [Myxococcales bacterium]